MSNWGQDNEKDQFQGGSDILRLAMKEQKYTIRILSEYKLFRFHWVNSVNRSVICDGVNCPICASGEKGQLKYVTSVIDREDGQVKLWEFSRRVKVAIQNIAEDYGSPEGYDLHVRRTGMKADNTVYTVTPAKEQVPLTEEEKALPKYDLEKLYAVTPLEKVNAYMAGRIPPRQDDERPRQGKPAPQSSGTPSPENMQGPSAGSVSADDLPTL